MKGVPVFILFFIIFSIGIVDAGTISSSGTHSEQNTINRAIDSVSKELGGTVYLEEGIYLIDGPIIIKSNVILTGDKNAIIRVSPNSRQWFTGANGIISSRESIRNVEISGFQIDGNIGNLPKSYADSRSDTSHDCEKLIILGGYSNDLVSVDGTIDDRIFTAEDEFGDNSSHIYFITFVDSIFSGADANFAVFKYTC